MDLSLLKFSPEIKGPMPYPIPLTCLVSLFKFPKLQLSWSSDSLEDYSELYEIGFNIFKIENNKARMSVYFPGLILQYKNF